MALDHIEADLGLPHPAMAIDAILKAMEADPSNWERYYQGHKDEVRYLKLFSYSDRIRYYWDKLPVALALQELIDNVSSAGLRAAAASQYGIQFPLSTDKIDPKALIAQRTETTIKRYYDAAGWLER